MQKKKLKMLIANGAKLLEDTDRCVVQLGQSFGLIDKFGRVRWYQALPPKS